MAGSRCCTLGDVESTQLYQSRRQEILEGNQSPFTEFPRRFVGARWREPASMGQRGMDPIYASTTAPKKGHNFERQQPATTVGFSTAACVFPGCNFLEVKRKGDDGKAGVGLILTNLWMPPLFEPVNQWVEMQELIHSKWGQARTGHQWILKIFLWHLIRSRFFILHSSRNRKGKETGSHWLCPGSRSFQWGALEPIYVGFGSCCSVDYWMKWKTLSWA